MIKSPLTDEQFLIKLAHTKMPFGKYKGSYLVDYPNIMLFGLATKDFLKGNLANNCN